MSKRRPEGAAPRRAGRPAAPRAAADVARPDLPEDPAAVRAALALWVTCVLLAAAHAAFAFDRSMWAWSLNLHRFLSPAAAWGPWLLGVLLLVPAIARRAAPACSRAGDAIARAPVVSTVAWMLGVALLAWLLPDRVRFVGDFLLRQGSVEELVPTPRVFPQALPLDALLHYRLPAGLVDGGMLDANGAARAIGALEAGLLAGLAAAWARTLGLRGVPALAATAIVVFGGYLAIFTGYGKAFSEMTVLTAAVAVFGVRVARSGRGFVALGIALTLAALLHRSGLGLLPAAVVAWTLGLRTAPQGPAPRVMAVRLVSIAAPLAAFGVMGPRILTTFQGADAAVHFASAEVRRHGGLLGAMFAGTRGADLVNLIALLAPAALAIPTMTLAARRVPGGREGPVLAALVLPFGLAMLFIHPANGLYRDWDDFAATGVAFALVAAWLAGDALRRAPRHAWVGVAVAGAVAVPTLQWLLHHTDLPRGLARVEAFVTEPPMRTEAERGTTWDYLGVRWFHLERWDAAANAFSHAAETMPSPRLLSEWAMAETRHGDLVKAVDVWEQVIARDSTSLIAWRGLAAVSSRLARFDQSRRAAERLLVLDPGNADARAILDYLDQQPPTP